MSDDFLKTTSPFFKPLTCYLGILTDQFQALLETLDGEGDHTPTLWKEKGRLESVLKNGKLYTTAYTDLDELHQALKTTPTTDLEMAVVLQQEIEALTITFQTLETTLLKLVAPLDERNDATAILEIRPGAGGEESALFAAELADIYAKYSRKNKWRLEVLENEKTSLGGLKSFSVLISGHDVWEKMFFESGVHRVQRVPETESSGRIHTSTVTVALLREPQELDLVIPEKDLKVDVFRSSGPGGQSVNTTDSAVRLTHIPTGLTVQQQDEKSQHRNKEKALKVLRARLYDFEMQKVATERANNRKQQVGTGDRSERIRTYNFPQGRVTDHRLPLTLPTLTDVLGKGDIDPFVTALQQSERLGRLNEKIPEAHL